MEPELVSFSSPAAPSEKEEEREGEEAEDISGVDSESDLVGEESRGVLGGGKAGEDVGLGGKNSLKKELTLLSGVAYIVGGIIGSGIFITPSTILCRTGSFGLSLIVWLIGGAIALAGGLCYTELGLLIRKSGADYCYIKEAYSFKKKYRSLEVFASLLSYLYAWMSTFILRPSSLAIISLTCSQYLIQPFYLSCEEVPQGPLKLIGISVIFTLAMINCYSLKLASRVMTVFTVVKILTFVFIVVVGVVFMIKRRSFPESFEHPFRTVPGLSLSVPSFASSLYGVLWAYTGWDTMGFAVEEIKNVNRTLPLSLLIGILTVIACYLVVNVFFFAILSADRILTSQAVGLPFGEDTLGTAGVVIILILVSVSAYGAANGSVYCTSRLIFVAARDNSLPGVLSAIHSTSKTPVAAILLQASIASLMVGVGTIDQLIDGFSFAAFIFNTLSITGLLILRVTHRKEPRLFKAWFIVPVAIFFISVSAFLIFAPLLDAPLSPLIALAFLVLGVPVYFFLVMQSPWKIRPRIFDRISENVSSVVNKILNTQSSRLT